MFLLDTHTLLWLENNSTFLSENVRRLILDTNNKCYFSTASLWEICIKHSIGRLEINGTLEEFFQSLIDTGLSELSITKEHLLELGTLPLHHKDPFDRLLIAQTIREKLTLVTKDNLMGKYDVSIIW